jgi:uncharacterized protein involved in propanediol utilization
MLDKPHSSNSWLREAKITTAAHVGEILQGVFYSHDGLLLHGVVSLPCPILDSTATFYLTGACHVGVLPPSKIKARRAAEATLGYLEISVGGDLVIDSDIPIERGWGSSTADVVSSIRAVAACIGRELSSDEIAHLAVSAEGASDGVMFGSQAVLYANEDGRVLEDYCGMFPPLEILALDFGGENVNTLAIRRPLYTDYETRIFCELRKSLRCAIEHQSPELLANVATMSALINQRHRPSCGFSICSKVYRRFGALGVAVAHSGQVLALMFNPSDPGIERKIALANVFLRLLPGVTVQRFSLP